MGKISFKKIQYTYINWNLDILYDIFLLNIYNQNMMILIPDDLILIL